MPTAKGKTVPSYLFVHPVVGLPAVGLILGAFAMKTRKRYYYNLHYVTGLCAFVIAFAARSIAVWAALRALAEGIDLARTVPTLRPHSLLASLVFLSLLVQTVMGLTMYLARGTQTRVIRLHRGNARILVGLAAIILLLGLTTLILLPLRI